VDILKATVLKERVLCTCKEGKSFSASLFVDVRVEKARFTGIINII
jgi:hypothetical protein